MIIKLLSLLACAPLCAGAQINTGPRITSMGNAGVAIQDIWSMQSNQAGIASLEAPTVSVAFLSHYFNPDIVTKSAVFVFPFNTYNAIGISFQRYGFSVYNEQKTGFAYARNFGNKLALAFNFNYHEIKIRNYGTETTFSADAGIQYHLNETLILASHIENLSKSGYRQLGNLIPLRIEFGTSYKSDDHILIAAAISKMLNSDLDIKAGIEYAVASWVALRGGISVNPFMQYAGFGLDYKGFRFDIAASSHPSLGYSPQLGLAYAF